MKRTIKKVAVLGSGVMGSRIACHFANVGLEVLLLDIVPREPNAAEAAKGLTTDHPAVRNRIVNDALAFAIKSNPNPLYKKSYANRIKTGNFTDDMAKIADCDWTIEVVIERLDIKKQVFENVEKYRKPGTLITSNTSGIPIHQMLEGRSEDFQKHFCGTHFFNPPRYLKLLEIIPTAKTDQAVVDFLMDYGDRFLGKTMVLCKDTPAFIANRVGVASIQALFHLVEEMDLTVTEVDKMTGPILGRAKSATFRTCDVVGLDTLVLVAGGLKANCPDDEARATFEMPSYIAKMTEKGWLGSKSGQGFFKKVGRDILELNLKTMEYQEPAKVDFPTLKAAKAEDNLKARMKILACGTDKAGEFYRKAFYGLFQYVSNRIPEITDDLYKIDDALGAGFGWQLGPFATWDALGVAETAKAMEAAGKKPAQWVYDMLAAGCETFYSVKDGKKMYYDIPSKSYKVVAGTEDLIILDNLRETNVVWSNSGATIFDIGDGVLNLEFHTKMNTIGSEILQGINKAIDLAEGDAKWKGVVIANNGENFSAGANLGMIFMLAAQQEVEELDMAVKAFQDTVMRIRYSSIPVVSAPHAMALGGGCEICLHSDKVIAAAETYIGLVEFGAGVIPAGAGSKEMALRASDDFQKDNLELPALRERFLTVGMAKVATSAEEAFELGIFRKGIDEVCINSERRIARAKRAVIELHEQGYSQPVERTDIKVLGQKGLGIFYAGARSMESAKYIS
ncbi:MAG: 3-hydroxyacyl-CoA dehydrogenase/enoyl-CoA hydratase family protein, partial [Flavobacteriales bacterium]|nr:3-hydroxyacyl-CoA dehydrogenase/enoyl-CoA hydratase family protein [Flavobacteriales bacterium]